jgi:hypothetical protein
MNFNTLSETTECLLHKPRCRAGLHNRSHRCLHSNLHGWLTAQLAAQAVEICEAFLRRDPLRSNDYNEGPLGH